MISSSRCSEYLSTSLNEDVASFSSCPAKTSKAKDASSTERVKIPTVSKDGANGNNP